MCLRNIERLVKPGGHLFVSGIDLDLLREVHEGDVSLKNGWPLEWYAQEAFCHDLPGWRIRYASVFQIGARP